MSFALKKGESLLYIIDSWDAFQSAKSKKAFIESVQDDKELKGDYDLLVQKYASRKFFPAFCDALDNNKIDATLVIISQVRAKIGATFGRKQTRTGGKALDFYTHQVAWIKEVEKLRKTKRGRKRVYGIKSEVFVDRSKVAKPFRDSQFVILYDYGLDDINSMADFLWGKKVISFDGKKFKTRQSFVKYIEEHNKEDELIKKTEEEWNKTEDAFKEEVLQRKPRY
jgi:RecA/RadA recombinase